MLSLLKLLAAAAPAHASEPTAVIRSADHPVAKTSDEAVNFPAGGLVGGPVINTASSAESGADTAVEDDEPNHWRIALSPYTRHWRYSAEHRHVWAIAIERVRSDGWLAGASFFRNSFGQPSNYVYVGRKHEGMLGVAPLFVAWSGGLMYGYTGKYQSKVPLNFGGYSPGFLLSAGWQFDRRLSTQINLLGDAAVMWQLNYAWR